MFRKILLLSFLNFLLISNVFGFDGTRKGMVLGGGMGITPVSKWSYNRYIYEDVSGTGLQMFIGYCPDGYNIVGYEGNLNLFDSDYYKQSILQGFHGVSWYHYYKKSARCFFSTFGLGLYVFDGKNYDAHDPSFAFLFGLGYEIFQHIQLTSYAAFGETLILNHGFNHFHLSFLISFFVY